MKSVIDRIRSLADEIEKEYAVPADMPVATSVFDGMEQLSQLLPEVRMSLSFEKRRGEAMTIHVGVYDLAFNSIASAKTVNAAVANAIRHLQAKQQTDDAESVPTETAVAVALPDLEPAF